MFLKIWNQAPMMWSLIMWGIIKLRITDVPVYDGYMNKVDGKMDGADIQLQEVVVSYFTANGFTRQYYSGESI